MQRIGELIPEAARRLGLDEELRTARALATFGAIVAERAPAASGACRLIRLDGFALVVVEPTVSGIARSKGQLYLLVTSRVSSRGASEGTRIAAETIRNEYYYDESAGIRVCLEKAIASVNKRLHHQRERLGLGPQHRDGPIGVGVAVVRGNELYVATVGPAEAYLIRQARLSILPDPNRERGLPARDLTVDVWRAAVNPGDSRLLVSPNVMIRLGPDELKDAMV